MHNNKYNPESTPGEEDDEQTQDDDDDYDFGYNDEPLTFG